MTTRSYDICDRKYASHIMNPKNEKETLEEESDSLTAELLDEFKQSISLGDGTEVNDLEEFLEQWNDLIVHANLGCVPNGSSQSFNTCSDGFSESYTDADSSFNNEGVHQYYPSTIQLLRPNDIVLVENPIEIQLRQKAYADLEAQLRSGDGTHINLNGMTVEELYSPAIVDHCGRPCTAPAGWTDTFRAITDVNPQWLCGYVAVHRLRAHLNVLESNDSLASSNRSDENINVNIMTNNINPRNRSGSGASDEYGRISRTRSVSGGDLFNCCSSGTGNAVSSMKCNNNSSNGSVPPGEIPLESVILLANRADVYALRSDCYDLIRQLFLTFVKDTLDSILQLTAAGAAAGQRFTDVITSHDVNDALLMQHDRCVLGFRFHRLRNGFDAGLMTILTKVHPTMGFSFRGMMTLNDILLYTLRLVFTRILRNGNGSNGSGHRPRPPPHLRLYKFTVPNTSVVGPFEDTAEAWACARDVNLETVPTLHPDSVQSTSQPAWKVKEGHDVISPAAAIVDLEELQQAVRCFLFGDLLKYGHNECLKALAETIPLIINRGEVAGLANRLYDVILTEAAITYLTKMLDYLAAEILEIAGNCCRDMNTSGVAFQLDPIHFRLAVRGDPELGTLYRGCVFRDERRKPRVKEINGYNAFSTRDPFDDDEHDYFQSLKRTNARPIPLSKQLLSTATSRPIFDPRTGFLLRGRLGPTDPSEWAAMTRLERKMQAYNELTPSQRELCDQALPPCCNEGTLAVARTIKNINWCEFRQVLEFSRAVMAACTQFSVERKYVSAVILATEEDGTSENGGGRRLRFTQEALNALHMAAEEHVVGLLASCARSHKDGMISAHDMHQTMLDYELWRCCLRGDCAGIATALAAGANVTAVDEYDNSIWWLCIHRNLPMSVKCLIDAPNGDAGIDMWDAAVKCIERCNVEILQMLMDCKKGIDLDRLLLIAAKQEHVECLGAVLDRGANILAVDEMTGNTALHVACKANMIDCAEVLLYRGADDSALNLRGQAPFALAPVEAQQRLLAARDVATNPGLK